MKRLNVFDHRKYFGIPGAPSILSACLLLLLFLHQQKAHHQWSFTGSPYSRRQISEVSPQNNLGAKALNVCAGLYENRGYKTKCEYSVSNPDCGSGGIFNYISFFYCDCQGLAYLGFIVLCTWLAVLIYSLSNNASEYFTCCLEKLAKLLKIPPTVAGVALLPLGNGAPDVFSSIAAFVGSGAGEVGLNSVLGAGLFVVCVVVGAVSLRVARQNVKIDKKCFYRDVCFYLFSLCSLLLVIIVGDISLGGAVAFFSIYIVYAFSVAANEILSIHRNRLKSGSVTPLLPVIMFSQENGQEEPLDVPLLYSDSESGHDFLRCKAKLPTWEDSTNSLWGWNDEDKLDGSNFSCFRLWSVLEIPLTLPRRLTIPIVEEDRWSKGYAIASVSLAPLLLAFVWNTQDNFGSLGGAISYLVGAIVGGVLGVLAFTYTRADQAPQKFLLPWVLGGFLMSIVWFYIIANELVTLLVALGVIFGIKPTLLGLTVLAWGNSMGDLVSDLALAADGREGVQIAMSGCYAGPMFNTLAGLGIPMLLGAWAKRPASYVVPRDASLYYTLGFIVLGLVWSLIVLPRSDMRPNKVLGMGLMAIYLLFLALRVSMALGIGSLNSPS
ncbi:hypothetical protein RJ639_032502 [Escallonia herrerae]|uniref:Sodium/calcium exchanger membrane region domain-containing protein n=1 Tax=Escallonia herrerae TaxID=1293975 RepID=A0AA89BBL5_9ASTE|nr:hypothetical protein RJ639_032502 [Escallonia herrerae]